MFKLYIFSLLLSLAFLTGCKGEIDGGKPEKIQQPDEDKQKIEKEEALKKQKLEEEQRLRLNEEAHAQELERKRKEELEKSQKDSQRKAQELRETEEAKALKEEQKQKEEEEKSLDEVLSEYKNYTIIGGPEGLLRHGSKEINTFTEKYLAFANKFLYNENFRNSMAIIKNYDLKKLEEKQRKKFSMARDAFKEYLELVFKGAPEKDIDAEIEKAREGLLLVPDMFSMVDILTNVALAVIGIKDFDSARTHTIKALKAMNEYLHKDYGLKQPNALTEAVSKLEAIILDGETGKSLRAGMAELEKANKALQELVNKFR